MRRLLLACLVLATTFVHAHPTTPAPGSGWPAYGGTLAGQRYSTEQQITPGNVATLQPAWVFHTHEPPPPPYRLGVKDKFPLRFPLLILPLGLLLSLPVRRLRWYGLLATFCLFAAAETSALIDYRKPPLPMLQARPSFEATPVLWNDTLYFDSPYDQVFAVDAATGKLRWNFDPKIDRNGPIYILASRGVSLWHAAHPQPGPCGRDSVLVATLDRRLIARDAITGAACPAFGANGSVDLTRGVDIGNWGLYEFTSPPTVVGDTIVLGSTVADNQVLFAASGAVRGFDARTGAQKWSWEPLPWSISRQPAQQPRTSGSGNAWSVISADPEHDLVFVPTGSPSLDFYGGTRPGDNRDADSLVALQASTGRRVWAFQLVHHDIWDYDTPSEPVLFTFHGNIPAVAVTTKTSMVFVFNRLTGQPLYPIEERPVAASTLPGEQAWPTQPFSTLPSLTPLSFTSADVHLHNPADQRYCVNALDKLVNHGLYTPASLEGSLVFPGSIGGANWGSSAFDPTTSVLYTRVSNIPYLVRESRRGPAGDTFRENAKRKVLEWLPLWAGGIPRPLRESMGTPDEGAEQRDSSPQAGAPYALDRQAVMTRSEVPCAPAPFGSIVALNLDTGQKLWSVPHGQMVQGEPGSAGDGGVIATAGGLIFAASTFDPYLRAYNAHTGQELWRGALPLPSQATPMTYASHGRQYVVIAAGGHAFLGKGTGDEVVAFTLPGQ